MAFPVLDAFHEHFKDGGITPTLSVFKPLSLLLSICAEKEEFESYNNRMSDEWLKDLEPLGTDWHKPFLETVPWLIIVFKKAYDLVDGDRRKNYYVNESVGLAAGVLITAIHKAGLVTLTHTPSPMNFLHKILDRPENERPFLLHFVMAANSVFQTSDITAIEPINCLKTCL